MSELGPTGDFPDGKYRDDDMGGLKVGIGIDGDKVFIAFGAYCKWVAMTPQGTIDFAGTLIQHARKAAAQQGITLIEEGV